MERPPTSFFFRFSSRSAPMAPTRSEELPMKPTKLAVAGLALAFLGLPESSAFARLKVVTTLQDLASLADAVGGDRVETFALVKGYQDPHFVGAKPSFILKLTRADALIVAGLELEIGYLPPLPDQRRDAKLHPGAAGCPRAPARSE